MGTDVVTTAVEVIEWSGIVTDGVGEIKQILMIILVSAAGGVLSIAAVKKGFAWLVALLKRA